MKKLIIMSIFLVNPFISYSYPPWMYEKMRKPSSPRQQELQKQARLYEGGLFEFFHSGKADNRFFKKLEKRLKLPKGTLVKSIKRKHKKK